MAGRNMVTFDAVTWDLVKACSTKAGLAPSVWVRQLVVLKLRESCGGVYVPTPGPKTDTQNPLPPATADADAAASAEAQVKGVPF